MDHDLDPLSRLKSRDSSLAPFAMLGAVAVTAGLTAYLAWPASVPRHENARHSSHISAIISVARTWPFASCIVSARRTRDPEDWPLFRQLSNEFEEERAVVRSLLTRLGASGRSMKRAASYASSAVLSLTAGGESGDLSLLQTLEALAVGVQGKRCMWRALQNLQTMSSPVQGTSFVDLEAQAVRQWEAIEERRRALVEPTFSTTDLGE